MSLKFLQKYGEAIKNSDKEKEWKYAKAKLKGKLSVTNDAEDLESILSHDPKQRRPRKIVSDHAAHGRCKKHRELNLRKTLHVYERQKSRRR